MSDDKDHGVQNHGETDPIDKEGLEKDVAEKDGGESKGRLTLRPASRTEVGRTVDAGSVRQSFSHGRSKVVQVEVRKKRGLGAVPDAEPVRPASTADQGSSPARGATAGPPPRTTAGAARSASVGPMPRSLTETELAARQRALVEQREVAKRDAERREQEKMSILSAAEAARRKSEDEARIAAQAASAEADAARAQAEIEAQALTDAVTGDDTGEHSAGTATPQHPATANAPPGVADEHSAANALVDNVAPLQPANRVPPAAPPQARTNTNTDRPNNDRAPFNRTSDRPSDRNAPNRA